MSKADDPFPTQQASAIPFRRSPDRLEFCLITSSKGHWCFPKGHVEDGETLVEAALKEALEEAGLRGQIVGEPVGSYEYVRGGKTIPVTVVLMEVQQCDKKWPEHRERDRRWVTFSEAVTLLWRQELRALLEQAVASLEAKLATNSLSA